MSLPPSPGSGRRPTAGKKVLASAVSMVAILGVVLGCVGLLTAETLSGLLVAGVLYLGGGLTLVRLAWRLYRGEPGLFARAEGLDPDQARALAREHARGQWLRAAKFLLVLVPVYLLVGALFEGSEEAFGAAAMVAVTSGGLGLLSWAAGRRAV